MPMMWQRRHGSPRPIRSASRFNAASTPTRAPWRWTTAAVHAAIVNILDNAVDACTRDSSRNAHCIVFTVTADANSVTFQIEDNGTGMDRETREKLFTLFYSSKGSRGTGLGLFIANNIVRQHHGEIKVASTPGAGSRFCVRLPRRLPESAKNHESQ